MVSHLKILAAAICASMFWSGGASAQLVERIDADQLEAILSEAGLNPTILEDATTNSVVASGELGEFNFVVRGFSCAGQPAACEELMFFANFGLGREVEESDFRTVNKYNDSQVFGRAYVLESKNEVGVDYVIELGGGVTAEHLSENIDRWADVVAAFVRKFQEGPPSS